MAKKRKLVPFWHPSLYRKAKKATPSEQTKELIKEMKRVAEEDKGVGLAAPQVGVSQRVIVVADGDRGYKALLNPEIKKKSQETVKVKEGCLSLSGVWCEKERARKVLAVAENEEGVRLEIEAEDMLAVVLQHEIDHLEGHLFISEFGFFTKVKLIFQHVFQKQEQPD